MFSLWSCEVVLSCLVKLKELRRLLIQILGSVRKIDNQSLPQVTLFQKLLEQIKNTSVNSEVHIRDKYLVEICLSNTVM